MSEIKCECQNWPRGTVPNQYNIKTRDARNAILEDLKQRFQRNDKSVLPLIESQRSRWSHPQKNYFSGCGEIECPLCGGRLDYVRSAKNGHITARCKTAGCVAWME